MASSTDLGKPVGVTLDRFIKRKQDSFPYATGELSQLLRDIGLAAKILNREITRSGLLDLEGAFGTQNVQGEAQQKLDVVANIRFKRALTNGGQVCALISEEEQEVITINPDASYLVAMDPLDGSSNIDVNVSIGTIFSIYRRKSEKGSQVTKEDVLQPGSAQVAAGYVLYGSSTILVYTTGRGVYGFTHGPTIGEFFLSHPNIQCIPDGKIYSINDGYWDQMSGKLHSFIENCRSKKLTSRYIGSLVADVHRNLLKGGIYIYPPFPKYPNGKLRLMYEANALAMIVEQSGGKASDGKQRILDIQPEDFHQRTPLFIGSANLVDKCLEMIS
ncbi:class 1 fructose-bisphosphatase [Tunicatimonas pelagia]|uniref:class 1 fructose-bisphosphatase n=1 Tax=Tunicatimonas pelagia TaxID=931531 RepID=UPI00266534E4|nr:class 1 fructose-bisphosphatase [Tunicatimonas pelagia]WKN41696.1 class 1 fructose-bisphosphatase [Tunicatimonas pelagia]